MVLLSYFHTGLRINHNHTEQSLTKDYDDNHKYVLVYTNKYMKYEVLTIVEINK
jgi:hypothetical protein